MDYRSSRANKKIAMAMGATGLARRGMVDESRRRSKRQSGHPCWSSSCLLPFSRPALARARSDTFSRSSGRRCARSSDENNSPPCDAGSRVGGRRDRAEDGLPSERRRPLLARSALTPDGGRSGRAGGARPEADEEQRGRTSGLQQDAPIAASLPGGWARWCLRSLSTWG
jgi:hypothetical protein